MCKYIIYIECLILLKNLKRQNKKKLTSRAMLRKKKQNEFEHLQYLKSQLDDNGVPLDLLNTDEQLLNNEQKIIIRLTKRLLEIDPRSFIESTYKYINTKFISKIIQYYNLNKENKSWIKQFFKDTYECLGFSNLYQYLTQEVPIESIKMTDKPVLTKELEDNIIRECSIGIDLYKLDISELINTVLLLDIQNRTYCNINQQKDQYISDNIQGGNSEDADFPYGIPAFWEMVLVALIKYLLRVPGIF